MWYVYTNAGDPERQKKASDPQEVGLQVVVSHLMWVLGPN